MVSNPGINVLNVVPTIVTQEGDRIRREQPHKGNAYELHLESHVKKNRRRIRTYHGWTPKISRDWNSWPGPIWIMRIIFGRNLLIMVHSMAWGTYARMLTECLIHASYLGAYKKKLPSPKQHNHNHHYQAHIWCKLIVHARVIAGMDSIRLLHSFIY